MDNDSEHMSQEELVGWNLIRAEAHCAQALDLIDKELGVKRGFRWRRRLVRAQKLLTTLVNHELNPDIKPD